MKRQQIKKEASRRILILYFECIKVVKKKSEEIKRKGSQRTINKLNVLLIFRLNHAFRV